MDNFEFSNTTELIFGRDTEKEVGRKIRQYSDCRKILLVYGSERIRKDGLYDRIAEPVRAQGIEIFDLGGSRGAQWFTERRAGAGLGIPPDRN